MRPSGKHSDDHGSVESSVKVSEAFNFLCRVRRCIMELVLDSITSCLLASLGYQSIEENE